MDAPNEVYEGLEGLKKYFAIDQDEKGFIFKCLKCSRRWRLNKGGEKHPGNVLHLLNHAYGHKK